MDKKERSCLDTLLIYTLWYKFSNDLDAQKDFGKNFVAKKLVPWKYVWTFPKVSPTRIGQLKWYQILQIFTQKCSNSRLSKTSHMVGKRCLRGPSYKPLFRSIYVIFHFYNSDHNRFRYPKPRLHVMSRWSSWSCRKRSQKNCYHAWKTFAIKKLHSRGESFSFISSTRYLVPLIIWHFKINLRKAVTAVQTV